MFLGRAVSLQTGQRRAGDDRGLHGRPPLIPAYRQVCTGITGHAEAVQTKMRSQHRVLELLSPYSGGRTIPPHPTGRAQYGHAVPLRHLLPHREAQRKSSKKPRTSTGFRGLSENQPPPRSSRPRPFIRLRITTRTTSRSRAEGRVMG